MKTRLSGWFHDPNYEWERFKEKTLMWVAWKMPRKITYWCAVRVMAAATKGEYETQIVPELLAIDTLSRWRKERPVYP